MRPSMENPQDYGLQTMTRLHTLAIRYFLYDRILSGRIVDRAAFRSAVDLYRKWSPDALAADARDAVSAILLDIIHDDPASFWMDTGSGDRPTTAAA